jgi:glycerol-3-phosphate dehydrogenase
MGRCQGGFCRPRVIEIISRELKIPYNEVSKRGEDTRYLFSRTKDFVLNPMEIEEEEEKESDEI